MLPFNAKLVWPMPLAQVWTPFYPTNISFQNQFVQFSQISNDEKNPKIQKLLQLRSKNYETNSIKSDSYRAFQQYLQNKFDFHFFFNYN